MQSYISSDCTSLPCNRIIAYLQTLAVTKKGLPHGLPLCVSAAHTITTTDDLLQLGSAIGPHIAIFEVFADIIDDWSDETVRQLTSLARKHSFVLWEGGRILNSTVNVVGKLSADSREVRNELVDLIRKKYTKGIIKPASWAGIATAWASGVPVDNQEADILIPTLKAAARESVAGTVQTIRTEITADISPSANNDEAEMETERHSPQHLSSDYAVDDDNSLGLPLRKASTISLTQTITQRTEDSMSPSQEPERHRWEYISNDGQQQQHQQQQQNVTVNDSLPTPPLLARGLVLCLPSVTDASFTPGYRQSCLAAARANQGFVLGFMCAEPWHLASQKHEIFNINPKHDQKTRPGEHNDDQPHDIAVFSPVPHRINMMNSMLIPEYKDDASEPSSPMTPIVSSSSTDTLHPLAAKLHSIIEQSLKLRKASASANVNVKPTPETTSGRRIIHIPIVALP